MSIPDRFIKRFRGEAEICDANIGLPRNDPLEQSQWQNINRGKKIAYTNCADELERYLMRKDTKPKPSKWHRVEDQLPKEYQDVEVRMVGYWNHDYQWTVETNPDPLQSPRVLKWRELPKPPKKGK